MTMSLQTISVSVLAGCNANVVSFDKKVIVIVTHMLVTVSVSGCNNLIVIGK